MVYSQTRRVLHRVQDRRRGPVHRQFADPLRARRSVRVSDFLATIYHHLGIDASKVTINDFNGRPTALVNDGKPIAELMGRTA